MTRNPGPIAALLALWAILLITLVVVADAEHPPAASDSQPQSAAVADSQPPSLTASATRAPDANAFPVPLASFATTLIGSTPARTANLRLAAAALDGVVIAPGEELSFNAVVGNRTAARGYQDAPVILRETRQVQIGGGICQVATNLFVAGLLAGLTPVERHRHSSPVDYVATGEDATIAWGAKDLKLRNDWPQPVRLAVEIVGRSLTARIDATESTGDRFELEREEQELPASSGEGTPGREVTLYRVRHTSDGTVERELVLRDVYPPSRPLAERSTR